jgi:tight adherence protein B
MTGLMLAACFASGVALLLARKRALPMPRLGARLTAQLHAAGLPGRSLLLLVVASVGAVLLGACVWALTRLPLLALLAVAAGAYIPFALLRARAERRWREREQAWPAALNQFADALEAGIAFPAALALAARSGPMPLRRELAQLHLRSHTSGLAAALEGLRTGGGGAARLAALLHGGLLELGGGALAPLLRQLAATLAAGEHSREKARSRAASLRLEALVLALSPIGFLLLIGAVSPGYLAAYRTTGGTLVSAFAALAIAGCYQAMRRLGRLPNSDASR